MDCASCGRANRPGNRFCSGCGRPLPPRCTACGAEAEPGARFCGACGAPLAALATEGAATPAARAADDVVARKVVTIVFADLTGSTALHERLDAESVRRFMDGYYQAMRGAVETHGGRVTQLLGDGVKAVFGAPRVAEDDAIRAVRAAVAMQRAFRELAEEQSGAVGRTALRVAVNTGEVVASEAAEIIGDPVNVAARLQEQARDGDVVIGEATRRLVSELVTLAPLGVLSLKGRSETVAAYRVVSLDRPVGASATPFVGRDDELRRILAVYDAAVADRRARLAVVLGSPGLGKSRVIGEVARRLGDAATVLSAHCDAAGGATFAPLADALRACLRIEEGAGGDAVRAALDAVVGEETDGGRIARGVAALLAGVPASPEETFFVVRRFLAALAAAQPVVLAIDDLQWAEPLLLDLTEHLVQWSTEVPLLVLVAARPELREARSSLAAQGGLVAEVVTLAGLDALAAMTLAANAIGAEELPAAVAGRVLATSEGNPLFVGELVRMLVQDGTLVRDGDRWKVAVELAGLEMPPTIQALLAARIERLRPEERTVLERAAVVGRQFSRAAVKELLPRELADFDRLLEALRRSELLEPDPGWFLGEPALRFHHVLIRDAAYRRLLKNTRAELHERFADWVAGRIGEAAAHDETLGWHLEQAHRHLRELGPLDAHGRALGERAARVLAEAGRRALARDDVPLAASLLGRALAALDAEDPARAELALDWCEALLAAGEVGEAAAAIDELGRFAGDSPRLRAWHTCFAGERAALTDPQALRATADAVAAAAAELAAAGDAAGEAKAHFVHAIALARLGRVGACEAALDRALAAARRGRDRRRANAVLSGAPQAALWGPSPVTRASGRCLDVVRVLRITQGAPAVEAIALRCQGVLEALRGRSDAARRMIATSRRMVEELGITQRLLEAEMFAGQIELIEGDPAAAEQRLRPAYDGLREHGLGIDAAQAAALLGRALLAQGRAAEAETLSHESEALAGDDLRAAVAWRGVRAEALARRGEHTAAIELARAAVEIASATDALLVHADARTALAAALRAAGRSAEAAAEEARAIELWEAKGATLLVERARREGARAVTPVPIEPVEPARPARRVQQNAATANLARLDALVAARDADAFPSLVTDEVRFVHHPTGLVYDREAVLQTLRGVIDQRDLTYRHDPLATLGDSLALFRHTMSATGIAMKRFDVGAYEVENIVLADVDVDERCRWVETFAADRLGEAVVRLYERYAELLPEGPERDRAEATARSVATAIAPLDPARWATAISPSVEWAGQGPASYPAGRGAQTMLRAIRSFLEVGSIITDRVDEVLALRPNALLRLGTSSGIDRSEGGAWERTQIYLFLFGADGLLARLEYFEPDRAAEALARFDELTAEPVAVQPTRRVRPNAATAHAARFDAVIAAQNADALPALFTDTTEAEDHTTGTTWDRRGILSSFRSLLRAHGPTCRHEPLGTLGDSLALCRFSTSASGFTGGSLDVGPYERQEFGVFDVDAEGRRDRGEIFAINRLGDAVVRLYERYAERLPAGPERTRAAAIARSVGLVLAPLDPTRWAAAISPEIGFFDHRSAAYPSSRGAEAFVRAIRADLETGEVATNQTDDVLALRPDALLVRGTSGGTDERSDGGAWERTQLSLYLFGADGLLTRLETFEPERAADALARFDALTAEPPRPTRRVRPNPATAYLTRLENAIAARDVDAFPALLAEHVEVVDHSFGVRFGRRELIAAYRAIVAARDPSYRVEPLATLGDSLALSRVLVSASGVTSSKLDVSAYAIEAFGLTEVDANGRERRSERFASEHLGDAIARLYERYAELLPDGPVRGRAAATARSVAAAIGPLEIDSTTATIAPDLEFVDHRALGFPHTRGSDAYLRAFRTLFEVATDIHVRIDDVLGLRSDALLVQRTSSGTDRTSGGAYERPMLSLWVFGAEGLRTRQEWFDVDREAEALARFDELASERARPPRRVRPNAATAHAARLDAAIAARDADAIADLLSATSRIVDYTTSATYDRDGALAIFDDLLASPDPRLRDEPLATLGDSLALCRISASASGSVIEPGVGAWEADHIGLLEVGAYGRRERLEIFAGDRLGDAVVRLYERYAELVPDGSEHERAAATACSAAALLAPADVSRHRAALVPEVQFVDHRTLGLGSSRGAERLLRGMQAKIDAETDIGTQIEDILDLRPDALLVRRKNLGTVRATGGAFEGRFLVLNLFGGDGRLVRTEMFDADRAAEALARFDELTAESARPVPRVRPNAATANGMRGDAAVAARDPTAIRALFADDVELVDHQTGGEYGLDGVLSSFRGLLSTRDPRWRHEPLATLGDSLGLFRASMSGSGFAGGRFDVGPYERVELATIEVDADGKRRWQELFAAGRLDHAIVRFYERYAESLPAGPTCARAAAIARSVAKATGPFVPDRYAESFAPEIVCVDHRLLGTWSAQGADEMRRGFQSWVDLTDDSAVHANGILALQPDALLLRRTFSGIGRDTGGAFEREFISLWVFGADGLIARWEVFDADAHEAALVRFDELTRGAAVRDPLHIPPNAATAAMDRVQAAFETRDWEGIRALCAPQMVYDERRRLVRTTGDRDMFAANAQLIAKAGTRLSRTLLATSGDRLALERFLYTGSRDGGPFEIDALCIIEVDAEGSIVAILSPEDRRAASVEMLDRTARSAPPGIPQASFEFARGVAEHDLARCRAALPDDFVFHSNRRTGLGRVEGADAYVASLADLFDLSPDAIIEAMYTVAVEKHGLLGVARTFGTLASGGEFESVYVSLARFEGDRVVGAELFELEDLDLARARFEELRPDPLRIPPNAASRARERSYEALAAHDSAALRALTSADFLYEDRGKRALASGGAEPWIQTLEFYRSQGGRPIRELIGTRGDRIEIVHITWTGVPGGSAFEIEFIVLFEVDTEGKLCAVIRFDADDRAAAFEEAETRFAAGEAAAIGGQPLFSALSRAQSRRDWAAMRGCFADGVAVRDHRTLGVGAETGDEFVASVRAQAELSPDVHVEAPRILAWNRHGRVSIMRALGSSLGGGGPFENVLIAVYMTEGDPIQCLELFDIDAADQALARFAELCAERG